MGSRFNVLANNDENNEQIMGQNQDQFQFGKLNNVGINVNELTGGYTGNGSELGVNKMGIRSKVIFG